MELDSRNEKMNAKIREFGLQKVPFILIMGDKEAEANAVSVRTRGKGDEGSVSVADFISSFAGAPQQQERLTLIYNGYEAYMRVDALTYLLTS